MKQDRETTHRLWRPHGGSAYVGYAVDIGLLALVPVLLGVVFTLPEATREQLVFSVEEPSLITAYTSPFVHLTRGHLFGNLIVYALVGPTTYVLSVLSGRQRLFRQTFVTILVAFPFALAGLQLVFPRERALFGFSGLNSALFGVLTFMLISYASAHLSRGIDERDAPGLLFIMLVLITVLVVPERAWMREIAVLSTVVSLLYVFSLIMQIGVPRWRDVVSGWGGGRAEIGMVGFGILSVFPFFGFYQTTASAAAVFDLYGHFLGYCLAFILVYISAVTIEATSE